MNILKCPVCGGELYLPGQPESTTAAEPNSAATNVDESNIAATNKSVANVLRCDLRHTFDVARAGYVNLLTGHSSSHGDGREMLLARREFLEAGCYEKLRDAVCEAARLSITVSDETAGQNDTVVIDAGCGEGYYTAGLWDRAKPDRLIAVDVSRDGVALTAKRFGKELRMREVICIAASVNALPIADRAADCVVSVFSPLAASEFRRVLRDGGRLIRAVPLEGHLMALKRAVYDNPYPNPAVSDSPEGFEEECRSELSFCMKLEQDMVKKLFDMTPYSHKTAPSDIRKLDAIDKLDVEAQFAVITYKKSNQSPSS